MFKCGAFIFLLIYAPGLLGIHDDSEMVVDVMMVVVVVMILVTDVLLYDIHRTLIGTF